jgi:hypothetical protein
MESVRQTTDAFEEILQESQRTPYRLTTDKGVEFTATKFQEMCKRNRIEHSTKDPQDMNGGTSRVDAVIGSIKRAMRRLQEMKGGSWLTQIQRAVIAHNKTPR